jgi:RHS repeat-associated protein
LTQTGNTLYYLHTDHLGSTSLTTDSSGNVVARQNYYPYGQIRPGGTGTMPTDVGFTGQRADATGLMFYNARYYSPYLNRWIQPDTIVPDPANPQSLNRYSYVYNNPVKRTDSTGRCADDDAVCKAYEQWILDWSGIILKDSAYRIWSADEARLIYETLYDIALKFNQIIPYKDVADLMKAAWEGVTLERMDYTLTGGAWLPPGYLGKRIQFPDWNSANGLWHDEAWTKHVIAEELGHSWDIQGTSLGGLNGGHISQAMIPYVGGSTRDCAILILLCWHYDPGPEDPVDDHAGSNPVEDWGGAFAQFVEPLPPGIRQPGILTPRREQFVRMQIALLVTEIGK